MAMYDLIWSRRSGHQEVYTGLSGRCWVTRLRQALWDAGESSTRTVSIA